ncbi:MAG TPA: reverse transcriptase domain-containing protein [Chthoniobacterales bacterium]|jgi:RNA-directed DNA polymerase|nr:reverse transcriptase domain-containing protein [Chthoniobacterales bacterium]
MKLDGALTKEGMQMVRHADDFVVLCTTQTQAQRALERISQWMQQAQLQLHPEQTKIIDATPAGGFEFSGYHFERVTSGQGKRVCSKCAQRSESEPVEPTAKA